MRFKHPASDGTDRAFATAFQVRDAGVEAIINVHLAGDVDVGAKEELARLETDIRGDRSCSTSTERNASFFNRYSLFRALALRHLANGSLQIQLRNRDRKMT